MFLIFHFYILSEVVFGFKSCRNRCCRFFYVEWCRNYVWRCLGARVMTFSRLKRCFTFQSFQSPIVVSIARSHFSESNGVGITFGDALEPKLRPTQVRLLVA